MSATPTGSPRVLIVRRDNIGDLVCTTPLIAHLRHCFPDARIDALVNSYNAPVLDSNPHLNGVHVYTKMKHREPGRSPFGVLWERLVALLAMRRARYDVAILAKSGFDAHGLKFARQIGAKRIIGYARTPAEARELDTALPQPDFAGIHEVEAVLGLASPLTPRTPADGTVRCIVSAKPDRATATLTTGGGPVVAMHLSARQAARIWPAERFAELAKAIVSRTPSVRILVTWSPGAADDPRHPGDDETAARFISLTSGLPVFPAPTPDLPALIANTDLCDIWIGTDGGAMHIAAALDKKLVSLFENNPAKHTHWRPWTRDYTMLHGDREIATIPVQPVIEATIAFLSDIEKPAPPASHA